MHLTPPFAAMMRGCESRIFNFKGFAQLTVSAINVLKCALIFGFDCGELLKTSSFPRTEWCLH
jgi:hypothetical protein